MHDSLSNTNTQNSTTDIRKKEAVLCTHLCAKDALTAWAMSTLDHLLPGGGKDRADVEGVVLALLAKKLA